MFIAWLFAALLLLTALPAFAVGQASTPPTINDQYTNLDYVFAGRVTVNSYLARIAGISFATVNGQTGTMITITPSPRDTTSMPDAPPLTVTFSLPTCRTDDPVIVSEEPAVCVGGTLSYGRHSIPTGYSVIPNSQAVINDATTNALIAGKFWTATDSGIGNSAGTIDYTPILTCPLNTPNFTVNIFIAGVPDVGDVSAINYVPSQMISGYNVSDFIAASFGNDCTTRPRQTNVLFNANPVVLPVCRASTPSDFPDLKIPYYQAMFNSPNPNTPINLAPGAVVYQLRVESLGANVTVDFHIQAVYLDGSFTDAVIITDFGNVVYFASTGKTPAFIYVCYYNYLTCTLTQIYKETDLFELGTCMCGYNLYCGSPPATSVPLGSLIPRASIPYFNNPVGFVDVPACAILVNPENNGSNPIVGQTVSAVSIAQGGKAPLTFNWQLTVPASVAKFTTPTTAATIQMTFFASGIYTIQHVVTGADGYRSPCSQQITVDQGLPILCYTPPTASGSRYSIQVGQPLVIDAACSTNPYGTPMAFGWTTFSYYNATVLPFTLSNTAGPVVTVTGSFPGLAVLFLNVTNQAVAAGIASGSAWQAFYITVYSLTPMVIPPGAPPFYTPLAPTCGLFPPAAPTPGVPFPPPTLQPPVGTMPSTPNPPNAIGPGGTTPFSGFFGPDAAIPDYFIPLLIFGFFAVILGTIGVYLYRYIRRRMGARYTVSGSGARGSNWFSQPASEGSGADR